MVTIIRGTEPILVGTIEPEEVQVTDLVKAVFTISQHNKLKISKEAQIDLVNKELKVQLTKEETLLLEHDHNYTYWQVLVTMVSDGRELANIRENMVVEEINYEGSL